MAMAHRHWRAYRSGGPQELPWNASPASSRGTLVAALIIGVFALFGQQILLYLGIRLPSLEAAGGCCWWSPLTCCAAKSRGCPEKGRSTSPSCRWGRRCWLGRGAIAAIMVFMREASTAAERVGVALGLVGVLVVLWLTLRFANSYGKACDRPPA
jgi:multiple antibiotic resistance protein